MKAKDKKEWLELYDVALKFQKLEPWKYLWDTELITYVSSELKDIFYCSVMGRAGQFTGLGIYQGEKIKKFFELSEGGYPSEILINYQECIVCNFLSKEDIIPKNLKIIKELGLKFRKTWISFEYFQKGYEPSEINMEQVRLMTKVLNNFYEAIKDMLENKIEIDFLSGKTYARYYDSNKKMYVNSVEELGIPSVKYSNIDVEDIFVKDMMKLPQTKIELEYEFLNYLPVRIGDLKDDDGRQYYPRSRFLVDRTNRFIISGNMINKKDYKEEKDYVNESFNILVNYFIENGRPSKIYVRDEETKVLLDNALKKIKIKVIVSKRLKFIDEVYENMPLFG